MGLKEKLKGAWGRVSDLEDDGPQRETEAGPIPYKDISKAVKEVMKKNVDVVGRRILIPAYYVIHFSEGDRNARAEVEDVLCSELKDELFSEMRKINPEQNKRDIFIEIETDPDLANGQFRIDHRMKIPESSDNTVPTVKPPAAEASRDSDFKPTVIEKVKEPHSGDEQKTVIQRPGAFGFKIVIETDVEKKTLSFTKNLISIGRASQDDVVLESEDFSISRSHATLETRDGNFYITPAGINGTFLNDEELELKKERQVFPGDELRIMDYQLRIELQ
jgi:hypothetical protein